LHQDEDVERVMVLAVSLGDEAVVVGVDDGGVEDTVNVEETGDLVEFVFDFRTARNLDNCRERREGGRGG
jgi:hypothetical protein